MMHPGRMKAQEIEGLMNLFVVFAVVLTGLAIAIIVRPLLRKVDDVPAAPVAAFVLGLAFPTAVLLMYLSISNHDWTAATTADTNGVLPSDINEMVAGLEDRLRAEPDDVDGWLMLGRTYAQLQQIPESRRAYRQALALEASPEAKLGVAEADIILDRENVRRDAGRLIEEVLAVEPDNPKALFYGGMVAMARNDIETFRDRWKRVLTMSPPDEIRTMIEAQLAQVGVQEQINETPDTGIAVNISVSAELAERIKPGAVLFLMAREPDRPGPPLAAVRRDASELPVTLKIQDSDAMIPGGMLSSLPRVQLIARITNSGEPVGQPGDLFGQMVWTAAENSGQDVSIVVDQIFD